MRFQRDGDASDDDCDDAVNHSASGADEPDIAAMQRNRLHTLFRTKPRLRRVVLHCQQLVFTKDIDTFLERRKKRLDSVGARKDASAQQRSSVPDRGLDALLASAVSHEFTVGGVQLTTSKPAGVVMLRLLECEEVDVHAETVLLLAQQMHRSNTVSHS